MATSNAIQPKGTWWSHLFKETDSVHFFPCGPHVGPVLCVQVCPALGSLLLGELLGSYQAVPCGQVNLKEQGQLVRQDEFAIWLGRRKCQRHVFLFEDLILFSKPKRIEGGFDVYIYKRSFKVRAALQIALVQEVTLDFSQKIVFLPCPACH